MSAVLMNLRQFWSERAPRERLVLGLGLAVVSAALVYWVLIEPAWSGVRSLERGLPATRAQAAQLEAYLTEANALKSRPQVAAVGAADARVAIEKSLAGAGLKATRVLSLSDTDLQLSFADVPYAAWAAWLADTERALGLRAYSVAAKRDKTAGNADIELVLRAAKR
jgi:general secretion pathway protein M